MPDLNFYSLQTICINKYHIINSLVTGDATITLTGTLLNTNAQTTIKFGDASCTGISGSATELTCSFSPGASGTFAAKVLVYPLGFATIDSGATLEVTSEVDSLTPDESNKIDL